MGHHQNNNSHGCFVRKAVDGDIDAMTELDRICFTVPWSRREFEKELTENPLALYIVAENLEGMITGYAGLWKVVDEGHITNVAVHPEYRNIGLGHELVGTLLKMAGEEAHIGNFTLEVRVSNEAAIKLYESFGFWEAGIRKGYYSGEGEDALIMWLMEDKRQI